MTVTHENAIFPKTKKRGQISHIVTKENFSVKMPPSYFMQSIKVTLTIPHRFFSIKVK